MHIWLAELEDVRDRRLSDSLNGHLDYPTAIVVFHCALPTIFRSASRLPKREFTSFSLVPSSVRVLAFIVKAGSNGKESSHRPLRGHACFRCASPIVLSGLLARSTHILSDYPLTGPVDCIYFDSGTTRFLSGPLILGGKAMYKIPEIWRLCPNQNQPFSGDFCPIWDPA